MTQLQKWCMLSGGALIMAACNDWTAPAPPAAVRLAFTVQPSNATAGVAISPAIAVAIQDASGSTVTSATNTVTVAIGTNAGGSGTVAGTASVAAVKGVATFSNVHVDKTGTGYTMTAAAEGLAGVTSAPFEISAGAATKVVFVTQPTNTTPGVAVSPAIAVAIEDALGNIVTSATDVVTLALGTNSGNGTLTGTASVAAVNGVALFSNLRVDSLGAGYTLTAAATGLTGATSAPFDIISVASRSAIIAFSSSLGIEEIHGDGSGRTVLIADPTASEPAWSPDGTKLAFTRTSTDSYTCEIYTAGADGSGAHQITSTLASFPYPRCADNPSWSPDGTRIAFSVYPGFDTGATFVANADGSKVTELVADAAPGFGYPGGPTWSPDGNQLAFECWGSDITLFVCVTNSDGSGVRTLTSAGGCESEPAWSPDGAEIAFVGSCEDGGPYTPNGPFGIWLKHPDGSSARNLTDVDFGADEFPAWSPDGTQLVFARGYPADLYVINRDGTGLRQLTSTPDISETLPAWRPTASAARATKPRSIQ